MTSRARSPISTAPARVRCCSIASPSSRPAFTPWKRSSVARHLRAAGRGEAGHAPGFPIDDAEDCRVMRSAVVVVAVLVSAAPLAQQRQSFTTTTTAILVDVVVRDKHGRPVTDLTASDFQVLEDGIVQTVDSFTRVSHGSGIGVGVAWRSAAKTVVVTPGVDAPTRAAAPAADDSTTALVFDHLSA